MPCDWCSYRAGGKCHDEADCDFKSLKMDKAAIIERIKQEVGVIEDLRKKVNLLSIQDAQVAYFNVIDTAKGIDIMAKVLEERFGMSEDEVKGIVVGARSAKTSAVLARMKASRRSR
jgi:hypothetical protein